MLKLEMRLDEKKIISVGQYKPERILKGLDNAFLKYGFKKAVLTDGTICYAGNNHPDDYAHFGGLITALKHKEWFLPYVDKWLWYNSDGQLDDRCYRVEDLLYHYTKQRSAQV